MFYNSIEDMPIYNWFKVNSTGDLRFCLIKHKSKYDNLKAKQSFDALYTEYIDTFGIGESYKKVLELKAHIIDLKIDRQIMDDPFIDNWINIAEIDLAELNAQTNKTNTNEVKVHLEKYLGFRLNEKEVSVKEYYTYLNVMATDRKAA